MEGSLVMKKKTLNSKFLQKATRSCLAMMCSVLLMPGEGIWAAQAQQAAAKSSQQPTTESAPAEAAKLPADQLDSLVAPIALYPDPLLAQILAASTYPLEIIQLQQWLGKNKDLTDKALVDAVSKQPWDPSVQGLAALPDVVKRLADDIQWITDLGNAFLAQQSEVMDAVQRMRKKAQDAGNLKSTEQQKVETKVVESKQVIVVEQANPQVIYVPSYNPVVVYGPPVYPYPPIVYPPPPPPGSYVAGVAIAFGVGIAMGAAWHGGWGYNCGWGGNNNINVNVNNNFNRNTSVNGGNKSINGGNRVNTGGGGGSWQHNPQHRGGTPYSNQSTANKFGGTTRGASTSQRQASARQNQANTGNRAQSGARTSQGQMNGQQSRGNAANSGGANRASSSSGSGNRPTSTNSKSSALGGGSSAKSGSTAKASSSRGSSSMGSKSSSGGGRRR